MPIASPFRSRIPVAFGAWPAENDPSLPTSTPVYDEWGWTSNYWKAADWLRWHKSLKAAYGQDEANWKFITAWDEQTTGANPISARSFNSEFISYAKANGFYEALFSGTGVLARPIAAGAEAVRTGSQVVEDVAAAASTVGTASRYLLPIAALVMGYLYLQSVTPRRR